MNAKAKTKKNLVRLVALLLAGMIFIGMLAVGTNSTGVTNTGYDFGSHLTKDGFFKDVTASELIELPDYSAYTMPKSLTEVSDDVVMQTIESEVLSQFTTQEKDTSADRVAESGDKVNLDYAGTIDGVAFDGGTAEGYDLTLGSGAFIPGFEDAIIGHKVGENFDIDVTFPEDYVDPEKDAEGAEQFNGKAAVFNITINNFYTTNTPEFNDEFVKENYGDFYATAQEMIDYYRADIIDQQEKYYIETLLFNEAEMKGEAPETITTFTKELMKSNLNAQASQFGMTADDLIILYGYENMDAYYEAVGIESYAKMYVLTQAFFEKEGMTVSDDYVEEYFKEMYGSQDYSSIISYYGKPYIKLSVMGDYMLETIAERLPVVDSTVTE